MKDGITGAIRAWWWVHVLGHAKPPGYGTWFRLRLRKP